MGELNIKGETIWVIYRDANHNDKFCLTSKIGDNSWYYLYDISSGKPVKIGKAKTPDEIENKFDVIKNLK